MPSTKWKLRWAILFLLPNTFFLILLLLNILFPLSAEKSFSKVIYAQDSSLLSAYLSTDDKWRLRTTTDQITPELQIAIIEKEDRYFYIHPGINAFSIARALFSNVFKQKRVSGASTITMQVARLMEPRDRTYSNKMLQMLRALQLEWYYSKKKIMELYLSYIPMGGNIEGINAGSYLYYGRAPDKLSLAQNVMLLVILNNPEYLRPDRYPERTIAERNKWLSEFEKSHVFPKNDIEEAIAEPSTVQRISFKNLAPHFCRYLLNTYKATEIVSTLNPAFQSKCESLLFNHIQRITEKQVTNGAVIVIDNQTMQVKAYCGSADFNDALHQGQVDGAAAFRSPGSALKPFLYALAMDRGLITPKMKLLDVPTNINGYVPENYDNTFHGQVSAAYALVQSLNIPAIRLLNDYNYKDFRNSLVASGNFAWISKNKDNLGLSIILGGCQVSLKELSQYYTSFANEGLLKPLHWIKENQANNTEKLLFSSASAWLIDGILSNNQRPDIPAYLLDQTELPKVAFKTGTSYGRKDGWAIGVTPRYTIGVWVGNFDGKGAPELSGAEMAVPLLFDIFNSIDSKSNKEWFPKPENVLIRKVCSITGMPASNLCEQQEDDYYIRQLSSRKLCDIEKEIYVRNDGKMQYCMQCLPTNGFKKETFVIYPAELMLYFKEKGKAVPLPPIHNPKCEAVFQGNGPTILFPAKGFEYLLDEDAPKKVMLQAASDATVSQHYWFIDGKYFQNAAPGEKLFSNFSKGIHTITCMDDLGCSTFIKIKINYL